MVTVSFVPHLFPCSMVGQGCGLRFLNIQYKDYDLNVKSIPPITMTRSAAPVPPPHIE